MIEHRGEGKGMTVYMEVTQDPLELPLAVAETARELADMTGVKVDAVYQSISRRQRGERKRTRFIRVTVEEDEKGENKDA